MQIWYVTENETELESTPIMYWLMGSLFKVRARLWGARYVTAFLGVKKLGRSTPRSLRL